MKLKQYSKYRDSGVQWIGKIPQDWESYRLKHVVNEFISGGTPSSDNEKFWTNNEDEKGIPWIAIGDMTNNEVILNTERRLTLDGLAEKGLKILKKGTIIYSIFASLGKVSVLGINSTTNQAILGLIISKKIDNSYLKYYLRNLEETIIALSNANTQNNLNSTIVKNIQLAIPQNLEEQIQIADFLNDKLSELNLLIEKDKFLIELLKERRIALINHAVTKGLNPKVKLIESGTEWIGKMPEHWEIKKIKFFTKEKRIKSTEMDKSGFFIGLENIESISGKLISYNSTENLEGESIKFRKNDVLFCKLRPYLAKVIVAEIDGFCTSELIIYEGNKDTYSNYLKYRLLSKQYIDYINSLTEGVKMPRADPIQLSNIKLPMPPKAEQIQIADFLDKATAKIDLTISKVESKIELLEEYKKSIIHNVVTGKVDVKQ